MHFNELLTEIQLKILEYNHKMSPIYVSTDLYIKKLTKMYIKEYFNRLISKFEIIKSIETVISKEKPEFGICHFLKNLSNLISTIFKPNINTKSYTYNIESLFIMTSSKNTIRGFNNKNQLNELNDLKELNIDPNETFFLHYLL